MGLSIIKDTIQQVADAITAALEIETEIVDDSLQILGGTGRFRKKIGLYEENGDLNSPYIYGYLLRTGASYFNADPQSDPLYNAVERELAEICCPIKLNENTLGLISLVALTSEQREKLLTKRNTLTSFLTIMAELIASRFLAETKNDSLNELLHSALDSSPSVTSFDSIVAESPVMLRLKQQALQIAPSDSTVLITGESGTGKELFARAIHNASYRAGYPFISINCGAIPEMLLESELFGYERGSFTGANKNGKAGKFELANKGTIFLDEIGDMPLHLQVKLLRVLQSKQIDKVGSSRPFDVDVRVIAATNRHLEEMIAQNQFREDLYFRLNVIPLYIPPLRERPEDIGFLIDFAFEKFKEKLGKNIAGISPEAYQCLCAYSWHGNARELENALEFAINMEDSPYIRVENLPDKIRLSQNPALLHNNFSGQTADYQRHLIINCLNETGWNLAGKQKAAAMLGISQSTLYRRLREK